MKKEIENTFLRAYSSDGVVHQCIDVIKWRNNLYPDCLSNIRSVVNHYNETMPNWIKNYTINFDESVIMSFDRPLIEEINNNLSECETIRDKERYIHTLIVPFNELSELLTDQFFLLKISTLLPTKLCFASGNNLFAAFHFSTKRSSVQH